MMVWRNIEKAATGIGNAYFVNGTAIRAEADPKFGKVGTSEDHSFIPEGEIWIDRSTDLEEVDSLLKHAEDKPEEKPPRIGDEVSVHLEKDRGYMIVAMGEIPNTKNPADGDPYDVIIGDKKGGQGGRYRCKIIGVIKDPTGNHKWIATTDGKMPNRKQLASIRGYRAARAEFLGKPHPIEIPGIEDKQVKSAADIGDLLSLQADTSRFWRAVTASLKRAEMGEQHEEEMARGMAAMVRSQASEHPGLLEGEQQPADARGVLSWLMESGPQDMMNRLKNDAEKARQQRDANKSGRSAAASPNKIPIAENWERAQKQPQGVRSFSEGLETNLSNPGGWSR